MNPILDVVVVLVALIAGGVVFDWRGCAGRHGQSHDIGARSPDPPAGSPSVPAAWQPN